MEYRRQMARLDLTLVRLECGHDKVVPRFVLNRPEHCATCFDEKVARRREQIQDGITRTLYLIGGRFTLEEVEEMFPNATAWEEEPQEK